MINKNLNIDEIFHLAGEYSNYIQEFDYENSRTPVSIYEFYEFKYQDILWRENE